MYKQFSNVLIILFTVLLPFNSVLAKVVEVEGSAAITDGAVNKARLLAIQDAIRQALLQSSVRVSTSSIVSSNVMIMDTTKIRATGKVSNVVVVDEWRNENEIHVLIRATVLKNAQAASKSQKAYRRKLAVVQFHVVDRRSIQDLPNIEIKYPQQLLRRIEDLGGVIGIDATNFVLNNPTDQLVEAAEYPDKQTIMSLANKLGVQFIVSGVLHNMSVTDHLFGDTRRLAMELQVFDGVTGLMLSRHTYNENARSAGLIESDVSFGSLDFFQTRFGRVIDTALATQAVLVQAELIRMPVTVRVVRSEGKQVYFDAGATSLVRIGDMLMAYKVDESPLVKVADSIDFGFPEKPVATLTVKKIQPLFSMGELETDMITLKPGDLLRFGW